MPFKRIIVLCLCGIIAAFNLGCQSKDKKATNETNTAIDSQMQLLHTPLDKRAKPHEFFVYPDDLDAATGRMWGFAILDASDRQRLFVTEGGGSGFTAMSPAYSEQAKYVAKSGRSVYIFEQSLYSSDGAKSTLLSADSKVLQFWISPDGAKVAYFAYNGLHVVNIDGAALRKIELPAGARLRYSYNEQRGAYYSSNPQFFANSSRLVFTANAPANGKNNLYSVNADGSDLQIVNAPLAADEFVGHSDQYPDIYYTYGYSDPFVFALSQTSDRIIYRIVKRGSVNGTYTYSSSLYSSAPDGQGDKLNIGGNMMPVNSSNYRFKLTPVFSPDAKYVLFRANAEDINVYELYLVPALGGDRIKISNGLNVSDRPTWKITAANKADILFGAGGVGVYSVSLDFTQPAIGVTTPLHVTPNQTHSVEGGLTLTPDASAVIYRALDPATNTFKLFRAKLDGSLTEEISSGIRAGGRVAHPYGESPAYILSPDGAFIVYMADAEFENDYALYMVNLGQPVLTPIRISPAYKSRGAAYSTMLGFYQGEFYFAYDQDAAFFAYHISSATLRNIGAGWPDFIAEDTYELIQNDSGSVQAFYIGDDYFNATSIGIANNGAQCRINPPTQALATGYLLDDRGNFNISVSGDAIVYTVTSNPNWQFFSATTANCASLPLSQNIGPGFGRIKISPDETKVALSGNTMYGMGIDGSNPVPLSQLDVQGSVERTNNGAFAFSADSSHVIYWAGNTRGGVMELYSAQFDGSPPKKINGPLIAGGSVHTNGFNFGPQITRDSRYVVYRARQDNDSLELYRSRIDGSENIKLSGALAAGSSVYADFSAGEFLITTNDQYVVYVVQQPQQGNYLRDLWVASIAGTQAPVVPVQLDRNKPTNRSVSTYDEQSFKISADSRYVVFMTVDRTGAEQSQLHSAAVDGSGMATLNSSLPATHSVERFTVSQDGQHVVYFAYDTVLDKISLYSNNMLGTAHRHLAVTRNITTLDSDQTQPLLTADNRVVFRSAAGDALYIIAIDGSGLRKVLDIPAGRYIRSAVLSPARGLILQADFREPGVFEVFAVKL